MSAAAAVSIGNYKGVMLCNRPFVSGCGGDPGKISGGGVKRTFMCGNVSSELGTNVPISSKERLVQSETRPRKETALQKHKKWLEELQKTKEEFERQYDNESRVKKEKHDRFMRREAKMRALIRKTKERATAAVVAANAKSETVFVVNDKSINQAEEEEKESMIQAEKSYSDENTNIKLPDCAESKEEEKNDKLRRPMWALTSKQAVDANDLIENEEADDLLDFAQGLDYEKYIQDSEVSTLIENVRARIRDLSAQEKKDDFDAKSDSTIDHELGDQIRAMKLTMANIQALESPIEGGNSSQNNDDASSVVASSVLGSEEGKRLGNIHSKKSLMAVAERSKAALATVIEEEGL